MNIPRSAPAGLALVAALAAQGCATTGGPGAGECARYMLGGAVVGAGVGAVTGSGGGERKRRAAGGAVVGAAAGYAICVRVWQQKRELDDALAPLDAALPAEPGADGAPRRVLRESRVVDNRAVKLDLDLMFATGDARLQPRVEPHLAVLAGSLVRHGESTVQIVGHTDATGDPQRNLRLSQERADAVARFLAARGVDRARLEVSGMGSRQPVADESTPAGRARNRRVEVMISPTVAE